MTDVELAALEEAHLPGVLLAVKAQLTLSAEDAALIAGFDVVVKNVAAGDGHTDTVIKVKLKEQARFVELGARHLGLLTERIELSGSLDLVTRLQAARKRLAAS